MGWKVGVRTRQGLLPELLKLRGSWAALEARIWHYSSNPAKNGPKMTCFAKKELFVKDGETTNCRQAVAWFSWISRSLTPVLTYMKSLLARAVASAIAIGTLVSCAGMSVASKSPKVLSKSKAERLAKSGAASWSSQMTGSSLPMTADVALKTAAADLPTDKHGRPTYHSQSIRHRYVRTTSYSHMENEPGAYGRLNAIGTTLKHGQVRSAAADWSRYPVGTTFKIKGLPYTYVIDDYGSALVGTNTIDIYHPTLKAMRHWGSRDVEINIIHWGSWERTANLLRKRTKYGHCARMYYAVLPKLNNDAAKTASTSKKSESDAL